MPNSFAPPTPGRAGAARLLLTALAICALLAGCASGVAPAPRIYLPEETRDRLGMPQAQVGATGEARYCARATVAKEQRRQALAGIAAACRGEDQYAVTGELPADVRYTSMGIETSCPRGEGRVIYFKCLGPNPRPSGVSR